MADTCKIVLGGLHFRSTEVFLQGDSDAGVLTFCLPIGTDTEVKVHAMGCADLMIYAPKTELRVYCEMWCLETKTAWFKHVSRGQFTIQFVGRPTFLETGLPFTPQAAVTPRCQCGSGVHEPGPAHSAYCHLLRV